MASSQTYRPSNGTEGEGFISAWCCNCERDRHEDCTILAATFAYDVEDAEYPREWCFDRQGRPQCTAFVPEGQALPPPRCPDTLDMFGGAPCPPTP